MPESEQGQSRTGLAGRAPRAPRPTGGLARTGSWRQLGAWILAGALVVGGWGPVGAQTLPDSVTPPDSVVTIGVRAVAPFVIEDADGGFSGLTIQLWEHIAGELGLQTRYVPRSLEALISGVESGSMFASASALTITSERESRVDFSHPFFVTGLGIAVAHQPAGLAQAALALLDPEFLWVVLLLIGLLLFWGVLVWVFERVENPEEFGGSSVQGIGNGFWWAAVTMTTVGYGDKSPRTLGGRVIGFIWMFTAIIVISFFTASIASSLTVTQLDSGVSGPQDLPNVRVGGLENSAALAYLDEEGIAASSFESLDAGLTAVAVGGIDAFVHDAPILRYLSREGFRGEVRVLSGTFVKQYYGIALPRGSEWRNEINRVLLDYLASDEWEALNEHYFGEGG